MLDVAVRADPLQERERLAVAAEHHVLAVVDQLAGVAVLERRRASAEPRPRVEHEHAHAALREQRRRTQPRKAAADDDHRDRLPLAAVTATSLIGSGSCGNGVRPLQPGPQGDQRAAGTGDPDDAGEDVVVGRARSSPGSRSRSRP